jgi:hypothetical protein
MEIFVSVSGTTMTDTPSREGIIEMLYHKLRHAETT